MIYEEAIAYIKGIERTGSDFGIERMRYLLDLLGCPDEQLKFVHVAGTNGKGSVCAYLTSIFKAAGYRVGTYNSPSVFCYNERWRVGGEPLCDEDVAKYMSVVRDAIDKENIARGIDIVGESRGDNDAGFGWNGKIREADTDKAWLCGKLAPTAFEIETATAFVAFSRKKCDIVILETGLGGRWDATNAIESKELAVITPIGFDHCALLGNTLGEIASEKAAIIKGDVVVSKQCDEVMNEISHPYVLRGGEKMHYEARVHICGQPILICDNIGGQRFLYGENEYYIKMLGAHQLENAAIAICAVDVLRDKGWNVPDSALKAGLASTVWQGRFEVVCGEALYRGICVGSGKTLVLDGAHNPHGATALSAAVKRYFGGKSIHLVIGVLKDKAVDEIVKIIAPLASKATSVTPPSVRALDREQLKSKLEKYVPCNLGENIKGAVQDALDSECDVVLLCGSLTLFEEF